MLILVGCEGQVPTIAPDTALVPTQTTIQNCRDFTVQVTVDEQQRQAMGQTCRQPDGSWQVTLNTPGLPQQVYTLPPQAIQQYAYPEPYLWWDPWFYGPLFGGGPLFVANRFHHRHFHHNGGSKHGSSRHGGSHKGRR